jgi:hypothetical protein
LDPVVDSGTGCGSEKEPRNSAHRVTEAHRGAARARAVPEGVPEVVIELARTIVTEPRLVTKAKGDHEISRSGCRSKT